MQTALAGLRLIALISKADPLKKFNVREIKPGLARETDEALIDYIKATASSGYHHVGTCRIGGHDDAGAVVDSKLRVRGIGHLRIADGSVMPALVSGNTNSVCIMIGERCAELIRTAAG